MIAAGVPVELHSYRGAIHAFQVIADSHGVHYLIRDLKSLDAASRRRALTMRDWVDKLDAFLHSLGYPFVEETANPVYALFLR